jgi:hypothetical protein
VYGTKNIEVGVLLLPLHRSHSVRWRKGGKILIQKHNLEHSDFYQHSYSLLDPFLWHCKYRVLFFCFADLFLLLHLPNYTVAIFPKHLTASSWQHLWNSIQHDPATEIPYLPHPSATVSGSLNWILITWPERAGLNQEHSPRVLSVATPGPPAALPLLCVQTCPWLKPGIGALLPLPWNGV